MKQRNGASSWGKGKYTHFSQNRFVLGDSTKSKDV